MSSKHDYRQSIPVFDKLADFEYGKVSPKYNYGTDEAFRYLTNLRSLHMESCDQSTITDEAFLHLTNLQFLNSVGCNLSTITAAVLSHAPWSGDTSPEYSSDMESE